MAPDPEWDDTDRAVRRRRDLVGLAAYEDSAVRAVLGHLGRPALVPAIAREVFDRTGVARCSFAVFAELVEFPVRFGVGRIKNVKYLAVPDLFDRFRKTALFRYLEELADEHGADRPLCLVFPFTGDRARPGPKGGRFMACHTVPSATMLGTTRIVRADRLAGVGVDIAIEPLKSLMAHFEDRQP